MTLYEERLAKQLDAQHVAAMPKGSFRAVILLKLMPDIGAVNGRYWNWRYSVREQAALYHYSQPGEAHQVEARRLDPNGHIQRTSKYQGMQRQKAELIGRLQKKLDTDKFDVGEINSEYDF